VSLKINISQLNNDKNRLAAYVLRLWKLHFNILLLCRDRKFLTDRKRPKNGIINTENTEQWLVAGIQMGIIITVKEFYGKM
jgi:hypothetical protein